MFYIHIIGKSFLLKAIARTAIDYGLNVCISAPTGKLASTYAEELPSCRCNTVHANYFVPVGDVEESNPINWSLADVHVLLVDEVVTSDVLSFFSKEKIVVSKAAFQGFYRLPHTHIVNIFFFYSFKDKKIIILQLLQVTQLESGIVKKIILTRNSLPLNPLLIFVGTNCDFISKHTYAITYLSWYI